MAGPETNGLIHFSSLLLSREALLTEHAQNNKNIATMVPSTRWLPAAPIFRGKCDRHSSRDRSRSLLSDNVIFIDESNKFLTLLTINYSLHSGWARPGTKGDNSDSTYLPIVPSKSHKAQRFSSMIVSLLMLTIAGCFLCFSLKTVKTLIIVQLKPYSWTNIFFPQSSCRGELLL